MHKEVNAHAKALQRYQSARNGTHFWSGFAFAAFVFGGWVHGCAALGAAGAAVMLRVRAGRALAASEKALRAAMAPPWEKPAVRQPWRPGN